MNGERENLLKRSVTVTGLSGCGLARHWARSGSAGRQDSLLLLLRDENADVRRHAIAALAKIADPVSTGRPGETLNDPDWQVRPGTVLALSAIGDEKSSAYLRAAISGPNDYVRQIAGAETRGRTRAGSG